MGWQTRKEDELNEMAWVDFTKVSDVAEAMIKLECMGDKWTDLLVGLLEYDDSDIDKFTNDALDLLAKQHKLVRLIIMERMKHLINVSAKEKS